MIYKVHMYAFLNGEIRHVEVDQSDLDAILKDMHSETNIFDYKDIGFLPGSIEEKKSYIVDPIINWDGVENGILNLIYQTGQNEFDPQEMPSVSVGDVIELNDNHLFGNCFYMVLPMGFKQMTQEELEAYKSKNRDERLLSAYLPMLNLKEKL